MKKAYRRRGEIRIRVPRNLYTLMRKQAGETNQSVNSLIVDAMETYLYSLSARLIEENRDYTYREELKRDGWQVLGNPFRSVNERMLALLKIIDSHYKRSLEAWGEWRMPTTERHGSWNEYVRCWLAQNGHNMNEDEDVTNALRSVFGPPKKVRLLKGGSYWVQKEFLGKQT